MLRYCVARFIFLVLFARGITDARCDDAFLLNSSCYRVHKNERVNWFTAVNRCHSNSGKLAVFDDDLRHYFPSSLMVEQAWIGLVKSWWIWPGLGKFVLVLLCGAP